METTGVSTGRPRGVAAQFRGCMFAPQTGSFPNTSSVVETKSSPFTVNSFYLDSAGRVQVSLPLQLSFASAAALEKVLESQCIQPTPLSKKETSSSNAAKDTGSDLYSLSIEARVTMTFGTGEAISATVESVSIESTSVKEDEKNVLLLQVQANLRVARQGEIVSSVAGVKVNLEVVAILTEKQKINSLQTSTSSDGKSSTTLLSKTGRERQALAIGLRDLHLGRLHSTADTSWASKSTTADASHVVTRIKLTPPILCRVSLDHALCVDARSMNGPTMGETWIALNISHSNTHSSPVTITNITLHPAFSEAETKDSTTDESPGASPDVTDMSQNVHWRFLHESSAAQNGNGELKFPKVLHPNEAFSTVLYLTAYEDNVSRMFSCPISVTATIQEGSEDDLHQSQGTEIVSVVNGDWTSAKRPISPSDSFNVEFTLPDPETVVVGGMFSLTLSVYNLGEERRDLYVKVSPDEYTQNAESVKKTLNDSLEFQCPDLETMLAVQNNTPQIGNKQLLAVDDSCLVGTVNHLERAEVKLRFIPLRTGALPFPNFVLVSSSGNKEGSPSTHRCVHNLEVVAQS